MRIWPNGTSGCRALLVVVECQSARAAVTGALRELGLLEFTSAEDLEDLSESDLQGFDAIIFGHRNLVRLWGCDGEMLLRLGRRSTIIVAFQSDELLQAAPVLPLCDGWVVVDYSLDHMMAAVELSLAGHAILPAGLVPDFGFEKLRKGLVSSLTERECEVLLQLGLGKSNMQIAHFLGIGETEAKRIVRCVLHKLNFRNRTEAGVFAYRHYSSAAPGTLIN